MENNIKEYMKTIVITGSSRGIGLEIAKKYAPLKYNIALLAKSSEPHPSLPGTIYSAAEEIKALGGNPLPLKVDIRDEAAVEKAMLTIHEQFGTIDALFNNASAICLESTKTLTAKKWDLMMDINIRGTFFCSKSAIPYMKQGSHIVMLSPPISLKPKWFKHHPAYTLSKYGMSLCVVGLSAENPHLYINGLWPATIIATSALKLVPGVDFEKDTRTPQIVADAAYYLTETMKETGQFFTDEDILKKQNITDFTAYLSRPDSVPQKDYYLD